MSSLRPPTEDDVAKVARLMSEHWPEPVDEDVVRRAWSAPNFDLAHDARLDGGAYARVEAIGEGRAWIDLRGQPSSALVDWAEARARELGVRVLSGAWTTNEAVLRELDGRGFRVVRYSQRMTIELNEEIPEPVWPEKVTVRCFEPGDERTFYEAEQETFADTWEPVTETYEEWAHFLVEAPTFDPELWFLAERGDESVGFAICNVHPGTAELGWIQLLGVRQPWRGLGIGRALLLHAFRVFFERGLTRAGLGVDSESPTGANRLYESVGMNAVARFELREKQYA